MAKVDKTRMALRDNPPSYRLNDTLLALRFDEIGKWLSNLEARKSSINTTNAKQERHYGRNSLYIAEKLDCRPRRLKTNYRNYKDFKIIAREAKRSKTDRPQTHTDIHIR